MLELCSGGVPESGINCRITKGNIIPKNSRGSGIGKMNGPIGLKIHGEHIANIFAGKDWEIRSSKTKKRGRIHLIETYSVLFI